MVHEPSNTFIEMKEIRPQKIKDGAVVVPGSKSYTHRMLICSALSDGICALENALVSEDTRFTMQALQQMGITIDKKRDVLMVNGRSGNFASCADAVYLGNSGTSMRLLTAVAALGQGMYTLTGTDRMGERPIQDLLDGLRQIGVGVRAVDNNGCPPVAVAGGSVEGGSVRLNCTVSSQFLSALLLISPYTAKGIDIHVVQGPVSRPYVDMTLDVMERFGITAEREGYDRFCVQGQQTYRSGTYAVEPDCSQAGYFWAAAAITGARIKVKGIARQSRQGDVRFTECLEQMGCVVHDLKDGIAVTGRPLSAITVDMADMPDMVPTLAVVAAFARGTTVIENVAHLKAKESDRLGAVVQELSKIGIEASCSDTGMIVKGGQPQGGAIDTYGDHRIAMSFALVGLKVPGIVIKDERCVEKSFPNYWEIFESLY
jgi:3-phosphoshikimate 1-carboxyvinyltransferase